MSSSIKLRSAYADLLNNTAEEYGATHWGVMKIGYLGRPRISVDRDLIKPLSVVFREYARDRCDLPKRERPKLEHMAPLVGVVELYDRTGNHDPHFNYFIALRPGEEPRYRGFLRLRFGRDATRDAETLEAISCPAGVGHVGRFFECHHPVPNYARAPRPMIHRGGVEPSFDLQPLRSDWRRAGTYSVKQYTTDQILTHKDLLEP